MYWVGNFAGSHFSQLGDLVILCTGRRFSQIGYFGVCELAGRRFQGKQF